MSLLCVCGDVCIVVLTLGRCGTILCDNRAQTALGHLDNFVLVVLPSTSIVFASSNAPSVIGTRFFPAVSMYLSCSQRAALVGYAPQNLRGTQLQEYIHPGDLLRLLDLLRAVSAASTLASASLQGTFRFKHRAADFVTLDIRCALLTSTADDASLQATPALRDLSLCKSAPIVLSAFPKTRNDHAAQLDGTAGIQAQNQVLRNKLRGMYKRQHLAVPPNSALNEQAIEHDSVTELQPADVASVPVGKAGLVSPSDYINAHMQTAGVSAGSMKKPKQV